MLLVEVFQVGPDFLLWADDRRHLYWEQYAPSQSHLTKAVSGISIYGVVIEQDYENGSDHAARPC